MFQLDTGFWVIGRGKPVWLSGRKNNKIQTRVPVGWRRGQAGLAIRLMLWVIYIFIMFCFLYSQHVFDVCFSLRACIWYMGNVSGVYCVCLFKEVLLLRIWPHLFCFCGHLNSECSPTGLHNMSHIAECVVHGYWLISSSYVFLIRWKPVCLIRCTCIRFDKLQITLAAIAAGVAQFHQIKLGKYPPSFHFILSHHQSSMSRSYSVI